MRMGWLIGSQQIFAGTNSLDASSKTSVRPQPGPLEPVPTQAGLRIRSWRRSERCLELQLRSCVEVIVAEV